MLCWQTFALNNRIAAGTWSVCCPPSHLALSCCPMLKSAEPLLVPTRKLVPPFNGLDVSPIVWVALLSFLSEILTGPQGILSLIARKGI